MSQYQKALPSGSADNGEEGSDSSGRAKRRRLDVGSQGESELGSSRRRLAPRRLPSDSPPGGQRSGSWEDEDEGRESELGGSSGGEAEGSSMTSASDWTYELVIIQHPQRARACGFGDKDRRPLSPPPIIRLYIRTVTGELVDPSKVAIQYLLVMVDLWSADLDQERNVVMHPAPTSKLASPAPPMPPTPTALEGLPNHRSDSRPTTAEGRPPTSHYPVAGWGWSEQNAARPTTSKSSGPSPHTRSSVPGLVQDHLPVPTSPTFARRPVSSPTPGHTVPSLSQHGLPSTQRPYTAPSQILRPLHPDARPYRSGSISLPPLASITESLPLGHPLACPLFPFRETATRASTGSMSSHPSAGASASDWTRSSYRPSSSAESSRPATDYSFGRSSTSTRYTSSFSSADGRERDRDPILVTGWPPPRPSISGEYPMESTVVGPPHVPQSWGAMATHDHLHPPPPITEGESPSVPHPLQSTASSTLVDEPDANTVFHQELDQDPQSTSSFSRVLVGSVCAMCQRLTDEDGDEGLFFFTHDLAVRTEGTFRLKFSLTNLEPFLHGASTTGEGAPVLAQAYSEPFTVYSAKKFPGVVATTSLTSLFASQNIRLPTRQKRGSVMGAGREDDGDDEEA